MIYAGTIIGWMCKKRKRTRITLRKLGCWGKKGGQKISQSLGFGGRRAAGLKGLAEDDCRRKRMRSEQGRYSTA